MERANLEPALGGPGAELSHARQPEHAEIRIADDFGHRPPKLVRLAGSGEASQNFCKIEILDPAHEAAPLWQAVLAEAQEATAREAA